MGPGFGSNKLQPKPEVSDEGSVEGEIRKFGHAFSHIMYTFSIKEKLY
jgi:hypothetical protein